MSEPNKITIAINANQTKKQVPQIDGMIALKKIENYSYALTDEIGLGYSSHVYKGKNDLTNEPVAIKVIDLKKEDELSKQFINDEIAVLQKIKQETAPNLLRLFDVFKTKNNLYIITEFCEGKDMAKILRKKKILSESEAQSLMKQLLKGYDQLHRLGVVHRDLKLANIFIKQGVIKLADFGFAISRERCQEKFEYNVGSPYYMPPQALKFNRYSPKSDVWSMGIIAYELVYGHLPWKNKNQSILFQMITTHPIEEMLTPEVSLSQSYRNFIIKCLQIDFDKRATPEFMAGYHWDLANDYVEGFAETQLHKPVSMIKLPGNTAQTHYPAPAKTYNTVQYIEDDQNHKHRNQMQSQYGTRGKSPAHRQSRELEFGKQFNPPILRQVPIQQQQTQPPMNTNIKASIQSRFPQKIYGVQQQQMNTTPAQFFPNMQSLYTNIQTSILGQIHYCRFLASLYDALSLHGLAINDLGMLKFELASKVLSKMQILRMLGDDHNLLNLQGFGVYIKQERWQKLKQMITKYELRFAHKFQHQVNRERSVNDQILISSIRQLSSNIQSNYALLQELTYYFQVKQLQKKQSALNFAINSKMQMLAGKRFASENNQVNCERLGNKLALLGF